LPDGRELAIKKGYSDDVKLFTKSFSGLESMYTSR